MVQENWNSGKITETGEAIPPAHPKRKDNLTVVDPGKIKRGKGGTLVNFVPFRCYFLQQKVNNNNVKVKIVCVPSGE